GRSCRGGSIAATRLDPEGMIGTRTCTCKEDCMATFTIQRNEQSGHIYVLEYDDDRAIGRYGPVHEDDLRGLTPDTLHLVEFDDEDVDEVWGLPLEYRDGEWVSGGS